MITVIDLTFHLLSGQRQNIQKIFRKIEVALELIEIQKNKIITKVLEMLPQHCFDGKSSVTSIVPKYMFVVSQQEM
jgi:hypothetical protein